MRKFLIKTCLVIFAFGIFGSTYARSYRSSPNDVYVQGYYTKKGKYVKGYYRTAPDSLKSNNYNCIDFKKCK